MDEIMEVTTEGVRQITFDVLKILGVIIVIIIIACIIAALAKKKKNRR